MYKTLPNPTANKKTNHLIKLSVLFILFFIFSNASAQTGSVGIGTNTPNVNAALDITSTTKGVLLPRLTQAQRNTLTPLLNVGTNGLLIYNVTTLRFNYWNGTQWNDVGLAGANGADGTVWFADALPPQTVPSNGLGKPNDFFLDGVTGDVYKKDISNTWVRFSGPNPVNLKNANKKEATAIAPFTITLPSSSFIQTLPFDGAVLGNAVFVSPDFELPNGLIISYARVVSPNLIEVKFYNASAGPITNPGGNYQIAVVKQ